MTHPTARQVLVRLSVVFGSLAVVAGLLTWFVLADADRVRCDEVRPGSGVQLRVPNRTWEIGEFCIDGACADAAPDAEHYVRVADAPADHTYRAVVAKPDGTEIEKTGLVTTRLVIGFDRDHGACVVAPATATVRFHDDGSVTIHHP